MDLNIIFTLFDFDNKQRKFTNWQFVFSAYSFPNKQMKKQLNK